MKSCFQIFFQILFSLLKFSNKITLLELDPLYDKWVSSMLSAVGLWPYQSRFSKRMSYGCFLMSSLSIIVALIAGLTDKWCTEPLIILENTLTIMFVGIGIILCTVLYKQEDKMRELYKEMANDWEEITDDKELRILKAFHRKKLVTVFTMLIICVPSFLSFSVISFLPGLRIATTVKEYNHVYPYYYSRMILTESMHYYQVVVHSCISITYSSLCFISISCAFISSVNHVCANYAIVSYKLKNVKKLKRKGEMLALERNRMIISKLINAVCKHRDAIHRIRLIESICSRGVLVVKVLALFAVSLIMADVMCSNDNPLQFLKAALVSVTFCFFLFHINFAAEQVIQVSNNIGTSAYSVDWVNMSTETRKLLCMIIMRSSKSDQLTAGSVVTLSNMTFAGFLKTCWAITTVLVSSQRRLRHSYM